MKLTAENGVEILTTLMHGNPNAVNNEYYGPHWHKYGYVQLLKKLVGHVVDPDNQNGVRIFAV